MLRVRPFGIFGSLKHMGDSERLRLVLFKLGPHLLAVPAAAVREVIPGGRATRIPGAAALVAGLVNFRGTLLTVVDGRIAIGLAETGVRSESVLVLDRGERSLGLAVDEVLDLVEVAPSDLRQGEGPAGLDPLMVSAAGTHAGRIFAVLDTDRLLAPALP